MSGTDFTTTPNLGLLKPIYRKAPGVWGEYWNNNADTLDTVLGTGPGGVFLPLAGGKMRGPLLLYGPPVGALEAATKDYVDTKPPFGGPYLKLAGGTVTGTAGYIGLTPLPGAGPWVGNTAQVFSKYNVTGSGGTTSGGSVVANGRFETSITGAPDAFMWSVLGIIDYSGTGGHGQHVAGYFQSIRRTSNAGGTPNNPELWGAVFECIDFTRTPSSQTNTMSGIELDMTCSDLDDARSRRALGIYLNPAHPGDVAPVCNLGIHIASVLGYYNSALLVESKVNEAAIDLRKVGRVTGAHSIWLNNGGDIAFDTAGNHVMFWDTAVLAGSGGIHINGPVQIDNLIYTPGNLIVGGSSQLNGDSGITGTLEVGGISTLQGAVKVQSGLTSLTNLQIGVGGPTWTAGTAAPSGTQPAGSMYSRIGGSVGARFYISDGAGGWTAVPGV